MNQRRPPDSGSGAVADAVPGAGLGVRPDARIGSAPGEVPGAAFGAGIPSVPDDGSAWGLLLRGVEAVAGEETWRHGEDDLVQRLRDFEAVRARLDAHRLALVRELDSRGWASRGGATSTQAWRAHAPLIDPRTAAADVRAAGALVPAGDAPPEPGVPVMIGARRSDDDPVLAATGRALTDGTVSRAHADAVLASVRALPAHPTTR